MWLQTLLMIRCWWRCTHDNRQVSFHTKITPQIIYQLTFPMFYSNFNDLLQIRNVQSGVHAWGNIFTYTLLMNGSIYIHFNDSSSTVVGTVGVLL